jgi:hypothetical protein
MTAKFLLYVAILVGLCDIVLRPGAPSQAVLDCQIRLDAIEDRVGIDEQLLLMAVEEIDQ